MWQCVKCHERLEDNFDVCWNCGTSRDGTEDPAFGKENGALAETEPEEAATSDVPLALPPFDFTPRQDAVIRELAAKMRFVEGDSGSDRFPI